MGFPGYLAPSPNTFDPSSIMSGAVTSGDLAFNTVYSGNIASGQVGWPHIANASIQSGSIASGVIFALHLASGGLGSGAIGSGQISTLHVASGGILSGAIGSGQVSTFHLASGAICSISQGVASIASGLPPTVITQEAISGVRAVAISQSGALWIAMAAVSGRMPAIGVVVDNVASGIQANVFTQGNIIFTSGLFTGIGFFGQPVWVGRSGHLCPQSGSFCSGGIGPTGFSGDIGQKMGVVLAIGSGGVHLNVSAVVWSGGPHGEATGGVI